MDCLGQAVECLIIRRCEAYPCIDTHETYEIELDPGVVNQIFHETSNTSKDGLLGANYIDHR
jgi:hypothetical protein